MASVVLVEEEAASVASSGDYCANSYLLVLQAGWGLFWSTLASCNLGCGRWFRRSLWRQRIT